jgi:hypothetical protein
VATTAGLGYVDQNRTLDPNRNVWEEISGGNEFTSSRSASAR